MTPDTIRTYFALQRRKGSSIPECVAATDFMIGQDLLNAVYARLDNETFHALLAASHVEAQLILFKAPEYIVELAGQNPKRLDDIRYVYAGGVKLFRTIAAWYDTKASDDFKAAIRKTAIEAFVRYHEKLSSRVFMRKNDGTPVLAIQGSFSAMLEVIPSAVVRLYRMALGEETTRIRQEHNRHLRLLQELVDAEERRETAEFRALFTEPSGKPS